MSGADAPYSRCTWKCRTHFVTAGNERWLAMRAKTFAAAGWISQRGSHGLLCGRKGLSQSWPMGPEPGQWRNQRPGNQQFLTALKTVCPHDAGLITNLRRDSVFTANDIILVQASFARLVPMQDAAADLFYGRLFTVVPKLRELFPVLICATRSEN